MFFCSFSAEVRFVLPSSAADEHAVFASPPSSVSPCPSGRVPRFPPASPAPASPSAGHAARARSPSADSGSVTPADPPPALAAAFSLRYLRRRPLACCERRRRCGARPRIAYSARAASWHASNGSSRTREATARDGAAQQRLGAQVSRPAPVSRK